MKKIFKSRLFLFIATAVVFTGIGVLADNIINANNISFTPQNTSWKKANGEDITNIEEAINELYEIKEVNDADYKILETGTVTSNTLGKSANQKYTITFENEYTSEQNAFLIITSPVRNTGSINPYIQSAQFTEQIIGNTLTFTILNYIGSGSGSVSFDYAVISPVEK